MIFQDILKDRQFICKLFSLTLPISMQSLMLALVAAADAFMLGKVSQDAMAAVSLATQIQFVQNILLYSIVCGIGILGAQYWGRKDKPMMIRIFGISVRDAAVVSLPFFIGCFFFPTQLMRLFASDPVLIEYGVEYLKIASWSYLLTGISQCYLAIMRVSDQAVCSAWISSVTVVLNIILNALFIFGLAGFPAMDIRGAALATVGARIFELLWCIALSGKANFIPLKLKKVFALSKTLTGEFWLYALPVLGSCLLWGVGFTSYTAIMGHLGSDAAAANSIASVVRDLICCLCNGIAGGVGILIGNELGAGNLTKGKTYGNWAALLAFVSGFVSSVIVLAFLPLLKGFVKLTPQAVEYMDGMFLILCVYMIGRCVCTVVINGIFSSGGDTLFDVYSLAVCMWGIALPCAFLGAFYFHLPVLAVYACTCLDEVGKVPWVMHHFKKYKWVKNITRDLP